MTGGEISGNTAGGSGDGVFVNGIFTMSASAVVKQDVHIAVGKQIAVSGVLAPPEGETYSAEIKPASTADGTVVVQGAGTYTLTDGDLKKFTLPGSGDTFLLQNNNKGILANTAGKTDDALYFIGDTPSYAPTLAIAISGIGTGTATVYIVQDEITVAGSINVSGNITLAAPGDGEKTVKRGSGSGSLFTVQSGASLTLDAGSGELTLDGGKNNGITANAALVEVVRGTLTMGAGVALQNNSNSNSNNSGGGIDVQNGTFIMTGGTISGNRSASGKGGGVRLGGESQWSPPMFEMTGGTISGNTSTLSGWGGGGVFVDGEGTFNMSGGEISGNTATNGGGVFQWNGIFNMSGNAVIRGNTAANRGGGVCQGHATYTSGGTFNMTGGAIYGSGAGDLSNTATSGGAAYYKNGGTVNPSGLGTTNNTIINGAVQ
jgi:hypothetical protein